MQETELLQEEKFQELEEFIKANNDKKGFLIPVLHKAQEIFGYLPKEVQAFVAENMNVPVSTVMGVVTFYSFFRMNPVGRHTITVCMGTACYVRGAKKIMEAVEKTLGIKPGETTEDRRFSLGVQRCLGACGLAPVIMVDNDVHGRMTAKKLEQVLELYK
ncbi:MAG: NADH dehydrogenase [Candidatus Cloacimonas sp. SDB]|nr:MAG: NADH dehydrogenase [Candidatus Cloacimonas sp. SDB]